jgi:MFS family permease
MGRASPVAGEPKPIAIALAGLLALAIAMGIGRFAFTPILPMMLHDGVLDLAGASWLATANYAGYWLGAVACALQPMLWRRLGRARALPHTTVVRAGLVATVLLTLAMALPVGPSPSSSPLASLWPLWRGLAGVASAFVFVYVSGWCLARLGELGAASLAGLIYVGPGLGIAASGLVGSVLVAQGASAAAAWLLFGALAAVLTALAWPHLRGAVQPPAATPPVGPAASTGRVVLFVVAYGLAGLGYIVTATFLPVIARQALPGSVWLDLFWPLFGLAVAAGALLTLKVPVRWDRRRLLTACYGLQAAGVLLGAWWPSLAGFALGSLLLGLPFTAITLFAVQEVRRLRPADASAFIGWLTVAYGLGQIAGPPLVAALLARSATAGAGFVVALEIAAGALLAGAAVFAGLARGRG